jgi:pyridoxal phosphate enzyme (YggS family)
MTEPLYDVAAALQEVKARMDRSARDADRDPSSVQLVCVSKGKQEPDILPALEAGERIFGENRVQEAQKKWPHMRERFPDLELHLIGPLQTNKVRDALALFDVIETLDRPKLAEALAKEIQSGSRSPEFFIEVNTGREPQKAGILPDQADEFIALCRDQLGLKVTGLMCIPPADEQASPHFALLSLIAKRNGLTKLSMGMSADYELGIQLGATHVRVGSAIFGARHYLEPAANAK